MLEAYLFWRCCVAGYEGLVYAYLMSEVADEYSSYINIVEEEIDPRGDEVFPF